MAFYQYRERDFMQIPAYELEVGDEIAYGYGGNLKYGVVKIEDITRVRGEGILIQYILPVGALAQSSETCTISIYWKSNLPDIHISVDINFNDTLLLLSEVK